MWHSLSIFFALSDEGRVRSVPVPSEGYLSQIQARMENELEVTCPTSMPASFRGPAGLWFEVSVAPQDKVLADGQSYRVINVTFACDEGSIVQAEEQLSAMCGEIADILNDAWPQVSSGFSFVGSSASTTPLEMDAFALKAA